MKRIFTLSFLFMGITSTAQFNYSTGYVLSIPQGNMAKNINSVHSVQATVLYQLPRKLSRIQTGFEINWGFYANESKRQTFRFDNGNVTETRVNYNSNMVQANLLTRVLLNQGTKVIPYISGKAGYTTLYSNVFVEDPEVADGCVALQQRNIVRDGTITTAYGGGMLFDFSLFSKKSRKARHFIDISVQQLRGGNTDYINTKRLYDANNPPVDSDGKPMTVQFINASTQNIHEHQVAELYTTPIRLLECRISYVVRL